jgi:hypothetical protein
MQFCVIILFVITWCMDNKLIIYLSIPTQIWDSEDGF